MQAVLLFLFYGGLLWLALMSLGYLRPRWIDEPEASRASDVDPRSPQAILDAGLTGGGTRPVMVEPEALERVYRSALAIAARKPHLLFAIGHVVAELRPVTSEEVDAAIETTVASVEGGAMDPGAEAAGGWHPMRVRAFLEGQPGERRRFFYLPSGWRTPWQFLACVDARQRRRPRADDLSLEPVSIDPGLRSGHGSGPRGDGRDRRVDVHIEGREHVVDRIVLRSEGNAAEAVGVRERIAIVAAGFAGGLLDDALPEDVLVAIRRGLEVQHDLATGVLAYTFHDERQEDGDGDRCVAFVEMVRDEA